MTISCTLCDAGMSGDPRVADSSGLRQLQVATGEIERGAVAEACLHLE